MKMKLKIIVMASVLGLPQLGMAARWAIVTPSVTALPFPSSITISNATPAYWPQNFQDGMRAGHCGVFVTINIPAPDRPGYVYSQTWEGHSPLTDGYKCNGVGPNGPWGSNGWLDDLSRAWGNVPLTSHSSPGFAFAGVASCEYWMYVGSPLGIAIDSASSNLGPCKAGEAKPVSSCTLSLPPLINLGEGIVGRVTKKRYFDGKLSCTATTSATLSLASDEIMLRNGTAKAPASIGFGENETLSTRVTASPDAIVRIATAMDTEVKDAGVYTGSTILTATWD